MANPSDGGRFSSTEFELIPGEGRGRGRGWQSLGTAIAQAAAVSPAVASAISPARRARGAECQSLGELLRGGERPAGELLQQCQAQLDREQIERAAFKLNAKMVHDGRESLRRGNAWAATMQDAIADGVAALALWRAGLAVQRDDDGGDALAVADGGGVCAAWVVEASPVPAPAEDDVAGWVTRYWAGRSGDVVRRVRFISTAARLAWRSLVESIARDTFGTAGDAASGAALDWFQWYQAQTRDDGGIEWRFDRAAALRFDRRARRRRETVEAMADKLASGRGRRGALADKIKQAAVLMLAGMSADAAATAAGFKASAGGKSGGGRVKAGDRLAAALRRAGLSVTARRGRWAQDVDEFERAKRRGAVVDLARTFAGLGVARVKGCVVSSNWATLTPSSRWLALPGAVRAALLASVRQV